MRFDVYAGESLVEPDRIRWSVEELKKKNLITTKTKEESRPDWVKRRAEMKEGEAEQAEEAEEEAPATNTQEKEDLALAVDLSKWKLGKPVVQKPGMFSSIQFPGFESDERNYGRWYDDLYRS